MTQSIPLMPDLRIDVNGPVTVITIDRPQARNAIGLDTIAELDSALEELGHSQASVVVITGAGDKAFVAGGDLKELDSVRDEEFGAQMARRMRRALDRIAVLPMPVFAAVNGVALGGGAEIAVACDFRIASSTARIGFTQVLLGVMAAWGGLERLAGLVGRGRAAYLLTSGRILSAEEAGSIGLFEEVAPEAGFERRWRELAETIGQVPRPALAGIKSGLQAAYPGHHPHLEEEAVRHFARAWSDPRHWEMAAELDRKRREARAGREPGPVDRD